MSEHVNTLNPAHVGIYRVEGSYPSTPPYSPSTAYPEYPWTETVGGASASNGSAGGQSNHVYEAVRGSLYQLGYDGAHYGTSDWNPLGDLVTPGDTVVLKPNFIRDFHDDPDGDISCIITQGAVIRAVLDYVMIALKGEGRVVVADAPQCEASFENICKITGLREIQAFCKERTSVPVDIIDLRPEFTEKVDGVIIGHRVLPGDPAGYTSINLGRDSEFTPINHLNHRLHGSEYDISEVAKHHNGDVHEYLISRTILDADVFINLPKLKTHKKVGVTLNLKNLVGINGNKNWLPHHLEGVPCTGGDQYAASGFSERFEQVMLATFKRHFPKLGRARKHMAAFMKSAGRKTFGDTNTDRIRSGNWYGNNTTWRMVLDLNRALRYGDGEGNLHETPQRRYFSFVDGILGAEGNGPMGGDVKQTGVIVAGPDPVAVDLACARLMGFDYQRIPTLRNALTPHRFALNGVFYDDIQCRSNDPDFDGALYEWEGSCFAFKPHFGWTGHVEIDSDVASVASQSRGAAGRALSSIVRAISAVLAFCVVFVLFASTAFVVASFRLLHFVTFARFKPRRFGQVRLLLAGTFYNENWFRSHVLPLTRTEGISDVYVVTDQPLSKTDKVTYVCPPRWAQKVFGRVLTRAYMIFKCSMKYHPDILMGYHIMPNALLCLLASSLFGGRSVYQMTGGPIQIIGGGPGSENALLCRLRRESWILERLIYHLVRQFDLVVVRGQKAVDFMAEHRLAKRIVIITGSIHIDPALLNRIQPQFDLVMVARHISEKQPSRFVDITHAISKYRPNVRAAFVGEGPLTTELKAQVKRLGIQRNVLFLGKLARVDEVLAASSLFVLTSQTEGLSIAMIEAMAAGLPVLVPNVGDLGSLVVDGENGFFIDPDDVENTARRIADLLDDEIRLQAMSHAAQQRATETNSITAIAGRWDRLLPGWLHADGALTSKASTSLRCELDNGQVSKKRLVTKKSALSKKNLWEATPPYLRRALGALPSHIPPQYLLGAKFRQNRQFVNDVDTWSADQSAEYQLQRLQRLISLAYDKSGYYRDAFADIGFEPGDLKSLEDLHDLPIIDKKVILEHLDDMVTTDVGMSHVDLVSTSGSSGMPLRFYTSSDRSAIEYAYLVAAWERASYRMDIPLAVIRGQLVQADRNGLFHEYDPILRRHYYSNFHMTDEHMERYLQHIATIGPCFLHVFPSSIAALSRFIDRSGVDVPANILGILAGSENIYDEDRRRAERTFGVRYYSWYGHSEKLVMASECAESTDYHVFPTYGYFELLDKDDRPINTPGQSGEIVGTGFINEITPFIRYRTGDFATYVSDHCKACGRAHPIINHLRGHRTQEVLVAADRSIISWAAINMHDDTFVRVRQFQFQQETPGEVVLRIVPTAGFGVEDVDRIHRNLNKKLEGRITFEVQIVRDIPLTKSGKSTYVDQHIDIDALLELEVSAS